MKVAKKFLTRVFINAVFKRRAFFIISDALLISFALYSSFWLRFNGIIPTRYKSIWVYYFLLALLAKLTFLVIFNLYDISWRFVSLKELIKVFKALSLGSITLGTILFLLRLNVPFKASAFPRSVLLLDYILSLFFIGSLRIFKRILLEGAKNVLKYKKEKFKTLIIGAGSAGEQIVREMLRNKDSCYLPVGLVDDDPAKQGIKIHGIKVLGNREYISEIIKNNEIHEILIALPSANSKDIREIVQIIRESKMKEKIKILPSTIDLINGKITLADIHEIELKDLLGRKAVNIDLKLIKNFIQDKKVLITGAGGSIGSELARLILQFNPKTLIIYDIDETEIFYLVNELKFANKEIIPVIGDIKDEIKMISIFEKFTPQIVLHSAAYKHVPILEFYPEEAVKTNVLGTKILAELSMKYNVEKFIFISTDKAINPTSVMGATKRIGEELLKVLDKKNKTRFTSVRFGNVLGSRGSVTYIFKEQIKRGGPVTVTHPEMKRYFMVVSEAVLLVLEAGALGQGGEVFVLNMGKPIKILDLAKEMIRLSGYEPDKDILIDFIDIRPGEKLFEEILDAEEGAESTQHQKIFRVKSSNKESDEILMEKINFLIETSNQSNQKSKIILLLKELIPTYQPYGHKSSLDYWY